MHLCALRQSKRFFVICAVSEGWAYRESGLVEIAVLDAAVTHKVAALTGEHNWHALLAVHFHFLFKD